MIPEAGVISNTPSSSPSPPSGIPPGDAVLQSSDWVRDGGYSDSPPPMCPLTETDHLPCVGDPPGVGVGSPRGDGIGG